jgi:hypothetical protein
LSTVLQNEYACARLETKNIPTIMTSVDMAIAVIKARVAVGLIVLQKYSNYHMHIWVKISSTIV